MNLYLRQFYIVEIQGLGSLGAYFKALWVEYKTGNYILKIKPILADQGFPLFQRGEKPGNEVACIHGYDRNTISLDNAISGVISAIKACGDAQKLSLFNQGFG